MGSERSLAVVMAVAVLLCWTGRVAAIQCNCATTLTWAIITSTPCTSISVGCTPAYVVDLADIPASAIDLTALSGLTLPAGGVLQIRNSNSLQSLVGLTMATPSGQDFDGVLLANLPNLNDFGGNAVGKFQLMTNPNGHGFTVRNTGVTDFRTLNGFTGLSYTEPGTAAFTIESNARLESLAGLPPLDYPKRVRIANNAVLRNLTGFGGQPQGQMNSLLSLTVTGNPSLLDIDALRMLGDTVTLSGTKLLAVTDNAALESVSGLMRLAPGVDTLWIEGNPRVQSVVLPDVTAVGTLRVARMDALTDLRMEALTETSTALILDSNPRLRNLDTFTQLTRFGSKLQLTDNGTPALASITGLSGLTSIAANANITLSRVCCPGYEFFQTTPAPQLSMQRLAACTECLNITRVQPAVGPNTGSQTVTVTVQGTPSSNVLQFFFGPYAVNTTRCTVGSSAYTLVSTPGAITNAFECEVLTPALTSTAVNGTWTLGVASVWPASVGVTRPAVESDAGVTYGYVTFDAFAGYTPNSVDVLPLTQRNDPFTRQLPGTENSQSDEASRAQLWVFAIVGGVVACWVVVVVALHRAGRSEPLKKADMFMMISRDPQAGVPDGPQAPVYLEAVVLRGQQTAIGGALSVLSLVLAAGVVVAFVAATTLDNDLSTVSYRPTTTTTQFVGAYAAEVTLVGYFGDCSASALHASWDGLEVSLPDGTDASTPTSAFSSLEFESTTRVGRGSGAPALPSCTVRYACRSCDLASTTALWRIDSQDDNQFAVAFEWSFTAYDFFGDASTASGTLSTGQPNAVFKGTRPFTASVVANPAVLSSYHYSANELPGVLVKYSGQIAGTSVAIDELGSSAGGPDFQLSVTALTSTLLISVQQKVSAVSILAQILAILSGAHGFGAVLLGLWQKGMYGVYASASPSTGNGNRVTRAGTLGGGGGGGLVAGAGHNGTNAAAGGAGVDSYAVEMADQRKRTTQAF